MDISQNIQSGTTLWPALTLVGIYPKIRHAKNPIFIHTFICTHVHTYVHKYMFCCDTIYKNQEMETNKVPKEEMDSERMPYTHSGISLIRY